MKLNPFEKDKTRIAYILAGHTVDTIRIRDEETRIFHDATRRAWRLEAPVPWNAPIVLPGGSSMVPREELLPELRALLSREAASAGAVNNFWGGDAPLWAGPVLASAVFMITVGLMIMPSLLENTINAITGK